jgi:hypothetical protein
MKFSKLLKEANKSEDDVIDYFTKHPPHHKDSLNESRTAPMWHGKTKIIYDDISMHKHLELQKLKLELHRNHCIQRRVDDVKILVTRDLEFPQMIKIPSYLQRFTRISNIYNGKNIIVKNILYSNNSQSMDIPTSIEYAKVAIFRWLNGFTNEHQYIIMDTNTFDIYSDELDQMELIHRPSPIQEIWPDTVDSTFVKFILQSISNRKKSFAEFIMKFPESDIRQALLESIDAL